MQKAGKILIHKCASLLSGSQVLSPCPLDTGNYAAHATEQSRSACLGRRPALEDQSHFAGGSLHGQSLVAGDVDIETGGGAVDVRKLMGTHVHLSTEDDEPASKACGAVSIGAVYADSLHLVTGDLQAWHIPVRLRSRQAHAVRVQGGMQAHRLLTRVSTICRRTLMPGGQECLGAEAAKYMACRRQGRSDTGAQHQSCLCGCAWRCWNHCGELGRYMRALSRCSFTRPCCGHGQVTWH